MTCAECRDFSGPSADGLSAHGADVLTCSAVGEQDSAADGSQQVLHSEPCVVLCAEAFMVIEADLEAFSPGRAAALGVRGGLAEGERAF